MIPNITRGQRMAGLLVYLTGPGRANEHEDPHLVAGDAALMSWHDDAQLNRDAALDIANHLDRPRQFYGTEVRDGHVFHCSLSLPSEDGDLTDRQWADIASGFVTAMGFTEDGGRAPCRWAAVRHGKSKKGNDHIHLVVSMVREDGTKFNDWKSHYRSQQVCRDLERQHGLTVLGILHAERGYTPAEQTRAEREERPEIHRHTLARLVRACAAASLDEAEFVRRARTTGLLLRPRYAAGRGDVVTGYSAALRPPRGERPIWFGGNTLARDLALPWLRINWPDTPESAAAALAEWNAAARHRRPAAPGREVLMPGPDAWKQYAHQVGELREKLASVPAGDWTAWAQAARDTAAAFAAWSRRTEPVPGPLADASRELARAAQLRHYPHPAVRAPLPSAGGAAMILLAASPPASREAYALLFRQLANTALAIHAMHAAAGDVRLLRGLGGAILRATETIRASAPASTPGDPAGAGTPQEPGLRPAGTDLPAAGGLRPGSPLPAPLTKHNREPAAHRSPGRRPGLER